MAELGFLIGGWLASPVMKSIVEKAQNYLGANYGLQKDTQGHGGPEKTNHQQSRSCKLAVYDAEDVLDDMEVKSIKEKVQGKNKVSKFASSSLSGLRNLFFSDENYKSLKKVVDKLNHLSNEIPNFLTLVNINKDSEVHDHEFTNQRETISQPLEQVGLYGRDDELNLILEVILDFPSESSKKGMTSYNPYKGLFVLPIVGMGGVGKTALAQAVYNNPDVQQTFKSKAWISVACNFDVLLLMRKIIQSLGGYLHLDVYTKEDASRKLSSIIGEVRFLVVLDDMFERIKNDWAVIFAILSHGAPGSVVLITTQNQAFANRVSTSIHIALSPFESSKFWELFKQFAFENVVVSENVVGKQIAGKLRGLPLAAKIIGNILRSNVDEDEWRRISKSEWWDMPEGKSQILPSIGLAYENLDPSLRQCFSYCSVFPRNSVTEKDRLVQMWIAHNFIPFDVTGRRLEDVGRQWFDKLVELSFFQPTGDKKGYVMPDLMHDLAVIVSSHECFYLSDQSLEIPPDVRHLAVDTKDLEIIKRIRMHKKLHSFLYFGFSHVDGMYGAINEILCNLDRIRVLDLSYLHMETKEPPTAIQNLQHLRFLDLSSTGIEVLSCSSFDHYHLQTLNIQNCQFFESPRGISKLINLRHLNADVETVALISGVGKLTNLQELNVYTIGKQEGHKISELKDLREITGHLKIDYCENIKNRDEVKEVKLVDKKHLDSVEICWSSLRRKSNVDIEILEGLKPHRHINELILRNYMGQSLPDWVMQISHFLNL